MVRTLTFRSQNLPFLTIENKLLLLTQIIQKNE